MNGITFRTPGPWGPGAGANLPAATIDANFWNLLQRVIELEDNPLQPIGIHTVTVVGSQFTVILTDGRQVGPMPLPVAEFNWRGEWASGVAYAALDVVVVEEVGVFLVVEDHTAPGSFDPHHTEESTSTEAAPVYHQIFGLVPTIMEVLDVITSSLTLAPEHANRFIRATNAGGLSLSFTDTLALGSEIMVRQSAASPVLLLESGATLLPVEGRAMQTGFEGAVVRAKKVAAGEWAVWGDLALEGDVVTEPTEPATEPATEPTTEPATEPATEPTEAPTATEPPTETESE